MDGQTNEPQKLVTVAAKGLLLRDGRALLVRRSSTDTSSPGMWEFPGGRVEFGERPEEALVREIMEETGLRAQPGRILYTHSFVREHPPAHLKHIMILNYLAFAGPGNVVLSFEHQDSLWATRTQMKEMLPPGILRSIQEAHIWEQPDIHIVASD